MDEPARCWISDRHGLIRRLGVAPFPLTPGN